MPLPTAPTVAAPIDPLLLHELCRDADLDALNILVASDERQDVNGRDAGGMTPAMVAVLGQDHVVDLLDLLDTIGDVDWVLQDPKGRSVAHLVAMHGDDEQMRHLCDHPVALDAPDHQGRSPLHLAAVHANSRVIEVLRTYGAHTGLQDAQGNTPDDLARQQVRRHGMPMTRMRLQESRNPTTILIHVLSRLAPHPDEIVDQVQRALRDGADPAAGMDSLMVRRGLPDGSRALHIAVVRDNPRAVAVLLAAGAPVDDLDDDRATPLLRAIRGRGAAVPALLAAGADLDLDDLHGRSPWTLAHNLLAADPAADHRRALRDLLVQARTGREQRALRSVLPTLFPSPGETSRRRERL